MASGVAALVRNLPAGSFAKFDEVVSAAGCATAGDGQNMVLNDLYAQVADSDDVTRKPSLMSWVQSLSYLSSQATISKAPKRHP
ncbi:hypothetical protein CTI12_AA157350 [Artemisia annua]|uniref:Uncharacterized protein n=1 Tax=Artemisia annua TaxID=35608 RepID=A0A2U1PG93_ARTAN|nr:hypothetical protein CTI12_AA157350 [Artemisia annua]